MKVLLSHLEELFLEKNQEQQQNKEELCPYKLVSVKNSHNAVAREHLADYLNISELVLRAGAVTELGRQLQGRTVALSGYLAPSLKRSSSTFLLTQGSSLPCMLCGNVHKIGAEIRIVLLKPQEASDVPVNEPVIITGQLFGILIYSRNLILIYKKRKNEKN